MAIHGNTRLHADATSDMERPSSSRDKALPSERARIAPVPYMNSYSTYLTSNERGVRPALWTSRSNTSMHSKTESSVSGQSYSISHPFPVSPHPGIRAETSVRAPAFPTHYAYIPTAPRTEPKLPSFVETARANKPSIVPGPKTEPNLPSFVLPPSTHGPSYTTASSALRTQPANLGKRPVTPADSAYGSITAPPSFDWANSIHTGPRSTHTGSGANIDYYAVRPANSYSSYCCSQSRKRPGRLARLKLALKELFRRKSVDDDSDLERIETSHWTE